MFGLFQLGIVQPGTVDDSAPPIVKQITAVAVSQVNVLSYLLTSTFVVFFATYKPRSHIGRCLLLVLRVAAMTLYGPLVIYLGGYIDGSVITGVLLLRLCYVSYYAYTYRSMQFIIFNSSLLAFVYGRADYYDRKKDEKQFVTLHGGPDYLHFGDSLITIVDRTDLTVAIRGRFDDDLPLIRNATLIDECQLYLFAKEPAVGVVNTSFNLQLYEDVEIS
nr:NS3 protein [Mimon bat coronavirus]